MSIKQRRWLHALIILAITLYLCWQNSSDSSAITTNVCDIIQQIFLRFGIGIVYSTTFYYLVRKIGHCLVFAILSFRIYLAFNVSIKNYRTALIVASTTSSVIAILAEANQLFFGRSANIYDVFINLIGVIFGILVALGFEIARFSSPP